MEKREHLIQSRSEIREQAHAEETAVLSYGSLTRRLCAQFSVRAPQEVFAEFVGDGVAQRELVGTSEQHVAQMAEQLFAVL